MSKPNRFFIVFRLAGFIVRNQASQGDKISKYHLEAGIAYWHTIKADTKEKWENILQLYNQLLLIEYSPIAAIIEAEKIKLADNHIYHSLLGELYTDIDNTQAISHLQKAWALAKSPTDKILISNKILECEQKLNC